VEPPPIAQGDLDTARSILEGWHTAGQRRPTDSNLTGRIWGLAECAHAIGDRDAAAVLYDRLLPYDGQLVVASISFIPASAAFTLGLLAQTLGQQGRAIVRRPRAQRTNAQPAGAIDVTSWCGWRWVNPGHARAHGCR
jgi:hypothetical protein